MKLRLVRETYTGRLHFRNGVEVSGVKPELVRKCRVLAKTFALVFRSVADGDVEISRNTGEFTLDVFLLHQFFNLIDGGGAGIPSRLRMILSEIFRHLVQAQVGDMREMRRGEAGVDHREPSSLREGDFHAGFLQ